MCLSLTLPLAAALPAGAGIGLASDGLGGGVGFARCSLVIAACAATAAGAGNVCARGSGGVDPWTAEVEVCASWAAAGTASHAFQVLTAIVEGESTVEGVHSQSSTTSTQCFIPPGGPPAVCVQHTTPRPSTHVADYSVCVDEVTLLSGSPLVSQIDCTTGASLTMGTGCYDAKAEATAGNEAGEATPPAATADGCSSASNLLKLVSLEQARAGNSQVDLVHVSELPEDLRVALETALYEDVLRSMRLATESWTQSPELEAARETYLASLVDSVAKSFLESEALVVGKVQ